MKPSPIPTPNPAHGSALNPSNVVLTGSLAANAVLIAFLVLGNSSSTTSSTVATGTASSTPATASAAANAGGAEPAAEAAAWTSLNSDDPAALRDRLRAEGFPPAVIRALVAEQVRLQFAPRRAALNLKAAERPFWEPATHDPKTAAALAQIMKEQNQALKDVLGPDATRDNFAAATLRRQLPHLSDEKIAAIQQAQQDLNTKMQDVLSSGSITGVDLNAFEKERRAEIAKILTPQELADYELRLGNTASSLRSQLAMFDPSEQEFRALHEIRRTFDERFSPLTGIVTQEDMRARSEAQAQQTAQIKELLGEQRFADYQRSTDYNFQQTSKLVSRLELPPETANHVYTVQQDLQQRARTLQMDRTLAPDARNAQLTALAAEAQTKVTSALGARGYEAYKQYGGSWLQQLQPRPVPVARPAAGATGGRGGGG